MCYLDKENFDYRAKNGTVFKSKTCNLESEILIEKPRGLKEKNFINDIIEMVGHHATLISPKLSRFVGYGSQKISIIEK